MIYSSRLRCSKILFNLKSQHFLNDLYLQNNLFANQILQVNIFQFKHFVITYSCFQLKSMICFNKKEISENE